MHKYLRLFLALFAAAALLVGGLAYLPEDTSAANLTGGTYTYVINGEEVTFTMDPISRKDGLLLPTEVFERFNFTIEGPLTKSPTLKRQGVTAKITLGSTLFDLDGKPEPVATAAMRLNGRLFLPADLLKHFGMEHTLDGTFLSLRDNAAGLSVVRTVSETEVADLKLNKTLTASVRTDASIYVTAEFTLLTRELIQASPLNLSYAHRVKLLNLLQTNTLVLVKVSNNSTRTGSLQTAGLYLIDENRRQYDVAQVYDIGEGLISAKLAPGADRTGVLIYPKVAGPGSLQVYSDANAYSLGSILHP